MGAMERCYGSLLNVSLAARRGRPLRCGAVSHHDMLGAEAMREISLSYPSLRAAPLVVGDTSSS